MRILTFIIFLNLFAFAAEASLRLYSESVAVYDRDAQEFLYLKNGSRKFVPASLTKVATMFWVLESARVGKINLNIPFKVSKEADSRKLHDAASKIGLKAGDNTNLHDLLLYMGTRSANDAAIAAATYLSGSEESFVNNLNKVLKSFHFKNLIFKDSTGFSPENIITAKSFAKLCDIYLKKFPDAADSYHSPKFIKGLHGNKLKNINFLVHRDKRVNGLKTGSTRASGYNIAISADTGKRKVIIVLLGIRGKISSIRVKRYSDYRKLMNFVKKIKR